jgi:hypothetical protein
MLEIRRHEWEERGENHASPFFVWVDEQPRFDLSDCEKCRYYRGDDPCAMAVKVGDKGDDKLYPFCGHVCGYFDMPNAHPHGTAVAGTVQGDVGTQVENRTT